jgi:hypothetical protein
MGALADLFWFADHKNNIGGIIASQILPCDGEFDICYS